MQARMGPRSVDPALPVLGSGAGTRMWVGGAAGCDRAPTGLVGELVWGPSQARLSGTPERAIRIRPRRTPWDDRGMNTVDLRPATPADSEFCFQLHKAAMGRHVAAVWGWDEADQHAYHARHFDPDSWQIITVDGTDAGILIVEYGATEVYLGRIEIHPHYQGRGIGAHLIESLIDTAAQRDQDLLLDVLAINTRAHAFYQRHGFREVSRHGENNRKIRMRFSHWQAKE